MQKLTVSLTVADTTHCQYQPLSISHMHSPSFVLLSSASRPRVCCIPDSIFASFHKNLGCARARSNPSSASLSQLEISQKHPAANSALIEKETVRRNAAFVSNKRKNTRRAITSVGSRARTKDTCSSQLGSLIIASATDTKASSPDTHLHTPGIVNFPRAVT